MFNLEDDKKVEKPKKSRSKDMIAKKDFHIVCNEDNIVIKEGDVVDVPEKYLQNLKTEGVI